MAAANFAADATRTLPIQAAQVRRPGPSTALFFAYLMFTAVRLFVDVEVTGPFDLGPILLTCAWVYETARRRRFVSTTSLGRQLK
jgi:hypothetical protein